jgi:hypothetical protein
MNLYIYDSYTMPTVPLFPAKWLWLNDFRCQNVYFSLCYMCLLSVLHLLLQLSSTVWNGMFRSKIVKKRWFKWYHFDKIVEAVQWSQELAFHSSIMEQSNMVSTVFRVTDLKSQMQFVGFLNLDFQASLYEWVFYVCGFFKFYFFKF